MQLTPGRRSRAGGAGRALLEGRRHDFLGKVEVLPEVLDALHGQVPVEVLPAVRGTKEQLVAAGSGERGEGSVGVASAHVFT